MARGINKVILVEQYVAGDSIPVVADRNGVSRSTVRAAAMKSGVIRSRVDGIRRAAEEGRLGHGWRGKSRTFSQGHIDAMTKAAKERGAKFSAGVSVKPNGYVEITRGEHKGRSLHRVIAEQMIGRQLLDFEVVHHKDHDRSNNDPSNLQVMTRAEHTSLHRKGEH